MANVLSEKLSGSCFTVLGVFLLTGCGSTPTTPTSTLTLEEKALIREYGRGGDYVVRWPDGDIRYMMQQVMQQLEQLFNEL